MTPPRRLLVQPLSTARSPQNSLPTFPSPNEYSWKEDGEVSLADCRQAVQQAANCTAEAGWKVSDVEPEPKSGRLGFSIDTTNLAEADIDASLNDASDCMTESSGNVEGYYLASTTPKGTELDLRWNSLIECLNGIGVHAQPYTSSKEVMIAITRDLSEDPDEIEPGFPVWTAM